MIPDRVSRWLVDQGYGQVTATRSVGGGCINNGAILETQSGKSLFLKTNRSCPKDMFAVEAAGLEALNVPGGPRVPQAFVVDEEFLLLEDLQPAPRRKTYWIDFGRQMAVLHLHTSDRFGFHSDNYIGSTPQPNPQVTDGFAFFARHRLGFQSELAAKRGLLSREEVRSIDHFSSRLAEIVPEQPASTLHGDLWSGNQITDASGDPAIIDPAVYFGWAEADLAMMTLFGSPGTGFWEGYNEVRTLELGYRDRFPLYNLYHLLNHLNLFGRSYYSKVVQTVRRYS